MVPRLFILALFTVISNSFSISQKLLSDTTFTENKRLKSGWTVVYSGKKENKSGSIFVKIYLSPTYNYSLKISSTIKDKACKKIQDFNITGQWESTGKMFLFYSDSTKIGGSNPFDQFDQSEFIHFTNEELELITEKKPTGVLKMTAPKSHKKWTRIYFNFKSDCYNNIWNGHYLTW